MTERLRQLLAHATHTQLLDFVTYTLCATHAQTIRATDLFLGQHPTHTLVKQTPDIISAIAAFFPLRMIFRSLARTSKYLYKVLNAPNLPHWRESPLWLKHKHPEWWEAHVSTSLPRMLRHVHHFSLNPSLLRHIESSIEKRHKLFVELQGNVVPQSIETIARIQCTSIELRVDQATPKNKATDAMVVTCVSPSVDFDRFPKLKNILMQREVNEGAVFPSTTQTLTLLQGAAAPLLRLPDGLRALVFVNVAPRKMFHLGFDMESLKNCGSLTWLSLSATYVWANVPIVLPSTLTELDFCFDVSAYGMLLQVDVSGCRSLRHLTTTVKMLQTVLTGWEHVPFLTVMVEGDEFKALEALLTHANLHTDLTILATCQCAVYAVARWLPRRSSFAQRRMKVRLAYVAWIGFPRIQVIVLHRDDLEAFDLTKSACCTAVDARLLRIAESEPPCGCKRTRPYPAFMQNENLESGNSEDYELTKALQNAAFLNF